MEDARHSILFVCTGNIARSIIAEAIANGRFQDRLVARSAGARPRGDVHPRALAALRARGIPTEGLRSKGMDEFAGEKFDLVVTLCDHARDLCPGPLGDGPRVHWNVPDPAGFPDDEYVFEAISNVLSEVIGVLAHGPGGTLVERGRACARAVRAAFAQQGR